MLRTVSHLQSQERGANAAEYALLASLIAVVIVAAVTALGLNLETLFQNPELHGALGS